MNRTGQTLTAQFTLVRHAKEFEAHVTKDGGKGWFMKDVNREGKQVTWECTQDDDGNHFSDLLETVGSFGASPDGTYKASLNNVRATPEY